MRRFLLLVSLLAVVSAGIPAAKAPGTVAAGATADNPAGIPAAKAPGTVAAGAAGGDFLLELGGRRQYAFTLQARGAEVTGICVVKTGLEGTRGSLVNEFGIHALDFTLSADRRRVKLLNVMPALNRWYIRRVVSRDLECLFHAQAAGRAKGRRVVSVGTDGTVTLTNERHNLNYSLRAINSDSDDTTQ